MTRCLKYFCGLGVSVFSLAAALPAATISLVSTNDTTLIEMAPTNNMGGQRFFNAGTTLNGTRNRAVLRFDLSQIPSGSKVTLVQLTLELVGQPTDMPASSNFRLHSLLKPWGEGTNASGLEGIGRGSGAKTNDATWLSRYAFTTNTWSQPGGLAGNDYSAMHSAEQFIYDVNSSPYTFGSTAQLAADVQGWVDHPEANFGWLLKTEDETVIASARRFGAREDAVNAPRLEITFIPPPKIEAVQLNGSRIEFSFLAEGTQPYAVQKRGEVFSGNSWTVLTNIAAVADDRQITIFDTVGTNAFYRIVAP